MRRSALHILTILSLQGCAIRSVYIPSTQNTPLFNKTRELTGAVYPGANHTEFQFAANPVNHLAVTANGNLGIGIVGLEAGGGFYNYTSSGKIRYELLAGYGYFYNSSHQTNIPSILTGKDIDYDVYARYYKHYIQPAIGYFGSMDYYNIHYSFSLAVQLSVNYFSSYQYRETDPYRSPGDPLYVVDKDYENKYLFTIQPSITNKVGYKDKFFVVLQLQTISPDSRQIDVRNTKFSSGFLISTGMQYNLQIRHKK